MEFGNGALLGGMALAAIPVIIHLVNRQRAKLRRFAAIDFLLLSDKRLARRLKLKQLAVLALRVLLLLALPLALAKPYVAPDELVATDASDPGGVAIIIDDSMSMQTTVDDGDTALERAKAEARELIDAGGARTSFAIVASGRPARLLTKELTYDKEALYRALDRIDAAPRAADLEGALREAGRVLSQAAEPRRQITLIGDQAAHTWSALSFPWSWAPASAVDVIDVRQGRPIDNLAITSVAVLRREGAHSADLEIEVSVVNHGREAADVRVEVEIGPKVVGDRLSVAPGARETLGFELAAPAGVRKGVARLSADDLAADNVWYFTIEQRDTVNVLVVNGAPRSVPYLDELFFLRAALSVSAGSGEVPLNPVFVTDADLEPAQIAPMDVVVLANVGRLTGEQRLALRNFVNDGGGLLITGGDSFDDEAADAYGDMLPYPLRGTKIVARPDDPASALTALTLATADFFHPVIEVFDGVDDASLFKARVFSYLLVDTVGRPGARVVASYTGGIPALVERPLGRGRVMMLTTTLDRDWSDLAIRSSFVPLVQRVCQYLGHALEQHGGRGQLVGQDLRIPIPEGHGRLVLLRPDGAEVELPDSPDEDTLGTAFVEAPEIAGHYQLRRAGDDRARATVVAVNACRNESDLTPASAEVIADVVAEVTADNGILPTADVGAEAPVLAGPGGERGRTILWPYILAGLLLLFGAEAWLVIRG